MEKRGGDHSQIHTNHSKVGQVEDGSETSARYNDLVYLCNLQNPRKKRALGRPGRQKVGLYGVAFCNTCLKIPQHFTAIMAEPDSIQAYRDSGAKLGRYRHFVGWPEEALRRTPGTQFG